MYSFEVDHRNLERRELRDLERANLLVVDLGFVVGQRDRSPHAARQQHRILPDEALGHVHEALVDRPDGPPILVLGLLEADFQVGDDVVVAGLSDLVPNLLGLGPVDEVLPQPLDDLLEVVAGNSPRCSSCRSGIRRRNGETHRRPC